VYPTPTQSLRVWLSDCVDLVALAWYESKQPNAGGLVVDLASDIECLTCCSCFCVTVLALFLCGSCSCQPSIDAD